MFKPYLQYNVSLLTKLLKTSGLAEGQTAVGEINRIASIPTGREDLRTISN